MPAERFEFPNGEGQLLAARLELPDGPPRAFALFAHCFTCGKDVIAATRIARALADHGVATLRFDFTGLGDSEGEFANTNFSSNTADLVAAADHLRRSWRAPDILIGHSLGGAAILAAAADVPEARAIVTIAAPSDPTHVTGLFRESLGDIRDRGEAEVQLAGRRFRIRRQFLDDAAEQRLVDRIGRLGKALMVLHSPVDAIVGIDNARRIFDAARHPKSFVSLEDADHLLARPADAAYVAGVVAAWVERYLDPPADAGATAPAATAEEEGTVLVTETGAGRFQQAVTAGRHRFLADEPAALGGLGSGPGPYDLLLAGLGACTAMTIRMYADRKGWPLAGVSVTLRHRKEHARDCAECESRDVKLDHIDREITLSGPLDDDRRARLLEIAEKCPVHRTLRSEIVIRTTGRVLPETA